MGKFVVKRVGKGFNFVLKAANGEVIAASEVYKTLENCRTGVQSVIRNSRVAKIEDQTVDGYEVLKHPKFEVYNDKAGQFRFRLKAKNGEIIATSEGYTTKASCLNGIDSVVRNAADRKIEEDLKREV